VIGTLSPLLGLFGTVLGMIEAFRRLEAAGSRVDPSILSGGIWGALLTTAVGLAVAIPTIAALNWLERRVERLAHDMDDAAARVFTSRIGLERVRTPAPAAVDRPDARASAPLPGKV
jgi:biopolymer transport protein ExbB